MVNSTENKTNDGDDPLAPKGAVSYLRVSTQGQAERGGGANEGFSIPAQREANKKKAASLGALVIKEFVDRGASARSADRPELKKMLEWIEENKDRTSYVIVHKIDRLARNRGDDVDITRALHKAGVKLVSTTENIDETPSGMLVHGIMSSIAEFYSYSLSCEVVKGLSQKAKSGGTTYKAPLGYRNVQTVDDVGRENHTVALDNERADLIRLAFKHYATGDWSINELAKHLAGRGLTTKATNKIPSRPISRSSLNKILVNPYFKGFVYYRGNLYPGNHIPLIDEKNWQTVQDVLSSHVNGERTRQHRHFLKSTVYCGNCDHRLLIHRAKSHTGAIYPYFVCAERHNKHSNCQQKAVLIEDVEYLIEELYKEISIPHDIRKQLEEWLNRKIRESDEEFSKGKTSLDQQENIKEGLKLAYELLDNLGLAYKSAPDKLKREINQAIFDSILVYGIAQ
jgi:DNA invertase Pin-like site-specific DNA recombinase